MNAYQRRRRIVFWLGSLPVLAGFTILVLALILADRVAPLSSRELNEVYLSQQVRHATELVNQRADSILAVSQ